MGTPSEIPSYDHLRCYLPTLPPSHGPTVQHPTFVVALSIESTPGLLPLKQRRSNSELGIVVPVVKPKPNGVIMSLLAHIYTPKTRGEVSDTLQASRNTSRSI